MNSNRYQVIMSNNAGELERSDPTATLYGAKRAFVELLSSLAHVEPGDTFTIVDHEPDKEPVYE